MSRFVATVGLLLMIGGSYTVPAAAPMVKTQPGFYRLMLGDFEVTALNDGVVAYPTMRVLPTATPDQIKGALSENALADPVGMSYNAFLINTGRELVLIDTGTGGKLDNEPEFHGAGHLLEHLRAAGYQPEQIDQVYITHRGPDHMGGLTVGGQRVFPNALVRAPASEFDQFLDPAQSASLLSKAHDVEKLRAWLQFTRDLFEPYIQVGKFRTFDADVTLVPGIRALATHGHTPGHTAYLVESRGHRLIIMGDLVLMQALQFSNPTLESSFDADPKGAVEQRLRIFKMAAEDDDWVAGGHLSFPGLGHIHGGDGHYLWIPANYAASP